MAKRVTENDIILINETYKLCGTISATALATGWSTSTVSKYIKKDYVPITQEKNDFKITFPSIEDTINFLKNTEKLTCLTEKEKRDLNGLKKRMLI